MRTKQLYDLCEMYQDLHKRIFFRARPRTNLPFVIARSELRMRNLDKTKSNGTFFVIVKNGYDPLLMIL